MAFKTSDEEAIEANFIVDIQRMGNELQKFLNNQIPRGEPLFSFEKREQLGCILKKGPAIKGEKSFEIVLDTNKYAPQRNIKITFEIVCVIYHNKRQVFKIPVSHRESYTKKEIERAKKSLMVKVLEGLKKV